MGSDTDETLERLQRDNMRLRERIIYLTGKLETTALELKKRELRIRNFKEQSSNTKAKAENLCRALRDTIRAHQSVESQLKDREAKINVLTEELGARNGEIRKLEEGNSTLRTSLAEQKVLLTSYAENVQVAKKQMEQAIQEKAWIEERYIKLSHEKEELMKRAITAERSLQHVEQTLKETNERHADEKKRLEDELALLRKDLEAEERRHEDSKKEAASTIERLKDEMARERSEAKETENQHDEQRRQLEARIQTLETELEQTKSNWEKVLMALKEQEETLKKPVIDGDWGEELLNRFVEQIQQERKHETVEQLREEINNMKTKNERLAARSQELLSQWKKRCTLLKTMHEWHVAAVRKEMKRKAKKKLEKYKKEMARLRAPPTPPPPPPPAPVRKSEPRRRRRRELEIEFEVSMEPKREQGKSSPRNGGRIEAAQPQSSEPHVEIVSADDKEKSSPVQFSGTSKKHVVLKPNEPVKIKLTT